MNYNRNIPEQQIPTNLKEAIEWLDLFLTDLEKQDIKNEKLENIIVFHSGLGRYIRNTWLLWQLGPMNKYFEDLKIYHPDDISMFVLRIYWHELNNLEPNINEMIKKINSFYEEKTV